MNFKNIFFLLILLLSFQACLAQTSETRSFSSFDKIDFKGAAKVFLTEGNKEEAKISAENLDLSDVITEVKNNTLYISMKKDKNYNNTKLTINLTYKKLEKIQVGGAIDLQSNSVIKSDKFQLKCSGAGNVSLKVDTRELAVDCSGASNLEMTGKTDYQTIELSGAGNFKGYGLQSNTSKVEVSGVGNVELNVQKELVANLSGMGNISYKGNPATKKINKSGFGSISSKN